MLELLGFVDSPTPVSQRRKGQGGEVAKAFVLALIAILFLCGAPRAKAQAIGSYIDLHDFQAGTVANAAGPSGLDGNFSLGSVAVDGNGNRYGTASEGGAYGGGIVWEITAAGQSLDLHDF